MTREEAKEILSRPFNMKNVPQDILEAHRIAIQALEHPEKNVVAVVPCGDCISRAEVLKLMQDNWHTHNGDWAMQESMDDIRALPSITPQEPKTGHWIDKQHLLSMCSAECSECKKRASGYIVDNGFSLEYKFYDYCPNCGADMREVKE